MTAHTLCVGTAGMSVWFSRDLGDTWERPYSETGLYLEARVWALSTHPQRPGEVLAGTDFGVFRWSEASRHWSHLPGPFDGDCTWALAQDSHNADVIVAGTHPAALYRSDDAGQSWRKLKVAVAPLLALGFFARRDLQHTLENLLPELLHRGATVEDFAAVDVHVVGLLEIQRRVGGELH